MRPPICDLCGQRFDPQAGGGTVRFSDAESLPDGMTGHPDGVEWYCDRHFQAAKKLSRKTYADASRELRRTHGRSTWLASLRRWLRFPPR